MFRVRDLKVQKGSEFSLQIDDLNLAESNLQLIIGPNGSGKTTLLRILAGLDSYNGQIQLNGTELNKVPRKLLAKKLAWVPAVHTVTFDIKVKDFIQLGRFAWHQGYPQKQDWLLVEKSLEQLRIGNFAGRMLSTLSSGEYQKVQVARSLAAEVQCILMDEPSAHLDLSSRIELGQLLKKLPIPVIMTSHDHLLARHFADRCLFLKDGKLGRVIEGQADAEDLAELFGINPVFLN